MVSSWADSFEPVFRSKIWFIYTLAHSVFPHTVRSDFSYAKTLPSRYPSKRPVESKPSQSATYFYAEAVYRSNLCSDNKLSACLSIWLHTYHPWRQRTGVGGSRGGIRSPSAEQSSTMSSIFFCTRSAGVQTNSYVHHHQHHGFLLTARSIATYGAGMACRCWIVGLSVVGLSVVTLLHCPDSQPDHLPACSDTC